MGEFSVVCGPMFSGKSEELIRRVRRALIGRRPVWVFKPEVDQRYAEKEVVSHDGRRVDAIAVASIRKIRERLDSDDAWNSKPGLVAIDELQFFGPDAADEETVRSVDALLQKLIRSPHRVVASGLDLDFRGQPFGVMPWAMALATRVDKLTAVCQRCGEPATRSQRLIDGRPAAWDTPVVQIGGTEAYEARCVPHWDPGR